MGEVNVCCHLKKYSAKKSLCFLPKKRQRLSDVEITKSPIKIKDHNISKGKVWINPQTRIEIISQGQVGFKFNSSLAKDAIASFSEFRKAQCYSVGEIFLHQGKVFQ